MIEWPLCVSVIDSHSGHSVVQLIFVMCLVLCNLSFDVVWDGLLVINYVITKTSVKKDTFEKES